MPDMPPQGSVQQNLSGKNGQERWQMAHRTPWLQGKQERGMSPEEALTPLCPTDLTPLIGVTCLVSIYGTHHNPTVWPDSKVSFSSPSVYPAERAVRGQQGLPCSASQEARHQDWMQDLGASPPPPIYSSMHCEFIRSINIY